MRGWKRPQRAVTILRMMLLIPRALACASLLTLVWIAAPGCSPSSVDRHDESAALSSPEADPVEERRKLAEILAVLELPDVRELKLVAHCLPCSGFRPAPAWPPVEPLVVGWHVESSAAEVRLLTVDGEIKVFGGGPPDGNTAWTWLTRERRVDSVRGSWTDAEFEEACNRGLFATVSGRGIAWHGVRYALLAHWSFQRGKSKLGDGWLREFRDWALRRPQHGREPEDWTVALCDAVFEGANFDANAAAVRGAARQELREFWVRFTKIPVANFQSKARSLVEAYESLIEEDARFREFSTEQWTALPASERAHYWFYKLRDLDSDPFESAFYLESIQKPGNAAQELAALGVEAKALLEAHKDDGRPTRCPLRGHRMSFEWRLMTYGEVCRQILDAMEQRSASAK